MPAPVVDAITGARGGLEDGLALCLDFTRGSFDSRITFTRVSTGAYFDAAGNLATAAINAPRLDNHPTSFAPRGLLIEEQRTNNIRNSAATGGAAGVAPTNWTVTTTGSGLTATIVGTATVKGITMLRVRFNGTTAAGSPKVSIGFDNGAPVMSGLAAGTQTPFSVVAMLNAGSMTGVSSAALTLTRENSAGSVLDTLSGTLAALPTGTYARPAYTPTLNDIGGTPYRLSAPTLVFNLAAATAVDFTVDIGAPQLETGPAESSIILTTGTTATRAKDFAEMLTAGWFNTARLGTFLVDALIPTTATGSTNQRMWGIGDGTTNERLTLVRFAGTGLGAAAGTVGGVNILGAGAGAFTITAGIPYLHAVSVGPDGVYRQAANGTAGTETTAALPAGWGNMIIGATAGNAQQLNGWVRRVRHWPRAMRSDELVRRTVW